MLINDYLLHAQVLVMSHVRTSDNTMTTENMSLSAKLFLHFSKIKKNCFMLRHTGHAKHDLNICIECDIVEMSAVTMNDPRAER